MDVEWVREDQNWCDYWVGSDEWDTSLSEDGGPRMLGLFAIARKKARTWLALQPDKDLVYLSVDKTIYKDIDGGIYDHIKPYSDDDGNHNLWKEDPNLDKKNDILIDLFERCGDIQRAFFAKIDEEVCKVTDEEADAFDAMIQSRVLAFLEEKGMEY